MSVFVCRSSKACCTNLSSFCKRSLSPCPPSLPLSFPPPLSPSLCLSACLCLLSSHMIRRVVIINTVILCQHSRPHTVQMLSPTHTLRPVPQCPRNTIQSLGIPYQSPPSSFFSFFFSLSFFLLSFSFMHIALGTRIQP